MKPQRVEGVVEQQVLRLGTVAVAANIRVDQLALRFAKPVLVVDVVDSHEPDQVIGATEADREARPRLRSLRLLLLHLVPPAFAAHRSPAVRPIGVVFAHHPAHHGTGVAFLDRAKVDTRSDSHRVRGRIMLDLDGRGYGPRLAGAGARLLPFGGITETRDPVPVQVLIEQAVNAVAVTDIPLAKSHGLARAELFEPCDHLRFISHQRELDDRLLPLIDHESHAHGDSFALPPVSVFAEDRVGRRLDEVIGKPVRVNQHRADRALVISADDQQVDSPLAGAVTRFTVVERGADAIGRERKWLKSPALSVAGISGRERAEIDFLTGEKGLPFRRGKESVGFAADSNGRSHGSTSKQAWRGRMAMAASWLRECTAQARHNTPERSRIFQISGGDVLGMGQAITEPGGPVT